MTTQSSTALYSLTICGRAVLNMHSLNNEGGEGNQIATRMVTIVTPANGSYRLSTVNAISGDMFKHIQAEHFYLLARSQGFNLCAGCERFSADRILGDSDFINNLPSRDAETIDQLLRRCALDDVAGSLVARGNRSIPRKSVVEFGWVVGLPDFTDTQSYFHVRYAAERGGEEAVEQPIFHRPASSGVYAIVAHLELARIGFNDITQQYVLDDEERARRHRTLLESVLYTFVEPNGAMRSTQNPHIVDFQGAITTSSDVVPAPALSPIRDDYLGELERLAGALNSLRAGAIRVQPFESPSAFGAVMQQIIANTAPYRLAC
jgi:CRISPR-associated protein Cst2